MAVYGYLQPLEAPNWYACGTGDEPEQTFALLLIERFNHLPPPSHNALRTAETTSEADVVSVFAPVWFEVIVRRWWRVTVVALHTNPPIFYIDVSLATNHAVEFLRCEDAEQTQRDHVGNACEKSTQLRSDVV